MPEIRVVLGDITQIPTEAIVNSANTSLLAGGGVCGAIHKTAGPELEAACRLIGRCPVGHAVLTPAFELPATWVIHAVGPRWLDGNRHEEALLRRCYGSIAAIAAAQGIKDITVPSISTGIYRFPLQAAAVIAIDTMHSEEVSLNTVTFVCFDLPAKEAYEHALLRAQSSQRRVS